MIVKLTGKVDGKEVIFERSEGDRWETTVPYDLDGMYVVEVTAVNDRGLIAYRTKMLMIVDPRTLCVQLLPYEYICEVVSRDYIVEVVHPSHSRGCLCE